MKEYEYQRNYELEAKNWYFVGMRQVFLSLIDKYRPAGVDRLKIADIGCGTGIMLEYLSEAGEIFGIDSSPEAIKFCKQRGISNVQVEDATSSSFKDNSFDLVTAFGLIEHVSDDRSLLAELKRICRPCGRILLFTSAFKCLWSEHDEANEHVRRYSFNELKQKIEEQGLAIIKMSYFNLLMFFPMWIVAKIENLAKRVRRKKTEEPQRFLFELPGFISAVLISLLKLEGWFFKRTDLPFGVNIICILEKR